MTDLKLGDMVHATNPLRRRRSYVTRRHEWLTPRYRAGKPIEGMVVGLRTYQDGVCSGGSNSDDPVTFKSDKSLKVALVCWHVRRKPVAYLLEDCVKVRKPAISNSDPTGSPRSELAQIFDAAREIGKTSRRKPQPRGS